ncbi:MAG: HlyD family efflux transporter periplasmic adaptor subunit [Chlamydiales bacterium]|nr:HlyD family efflux transporter periplasmic adaptor subunit [Chlamydiales bacterium]
MKTTVTNKQNGKKMPDQPVENNDLQVKRKKYLAWTTTILVVIGVVCFLMWWFYFRIEDSTEDAYVHGNALELTTQVPGIVKSINTDNTYFVQKNQVLIELDPTDYELQLRKTAADLGQAVRHVATLFDDVGEKRAEMERAQAELIKAQQDYDHRAGVIGIGGVSLEDFEHSQAELRSARAEASRAQCAYEAAVARVDNTTLYTHPEVIAAQEKMKEAYVNLRRTKIVAPTDGIVDKRSIQIGEWVNPNDPLLAVVPIDQMWVEANYKEIHLKRIRIGQPVKMHADIYGDEVLFNGKVVGLGMGTGAAFSILPPQNATGNWIKIVQRLPVRISFEPEQLRRYPLRIGLSMDVTVDTKNERGGVIPPPQNVLEPMYYTDVYSHQEDGVQEWVDAIMRQNVPRHLCQ